MTTTTGPARTRHPNALAEFIATTRPGWSNAALADATRVSPDAAPSPCAAWWQQAKSRRRATARGSSPLLCRRPSDRVLAGAARALNVTVEELLVVVQAAMFEAPR